MRSLLLLVAAIPFSFSIHAQDLRIRVLDEEMDRDTRLLYDFMGVQRFSIEVELPGEKKHDVIWVARSMTPEGEERRDTIFNTLAMGKMFAGGYPTDPLKDLVVVIGKDDNGDLKIKGNGFNGKVSIHADAAYALMNGIDGQELVTRKFNEAIPVMIYSQPYVDKNNASVLRYCYTNEIPPDQWCSTFGVPHLIILELTVLS